MAIAPVLERESEVKERNYSYSGYTPEEELHNARIRENYARLINADYIKEEQAPAYSEPEQETAKRVFDFTPVAEAPVQPAAVQTVESARADSILFRADSAVNRRLFVDTEKADANSENEDEENEDLLPTKTTIQYKTNSEKRFYEEGKIANVSDGKRSLMSKKEKIIIAVVVSVIVALFILVIVNSAIISNINNDMGTLQSSLSEAKTAFKNASDRLDDVNENLYDSVMEYVVENNGVAN